MMGETAIRFAEVFAEILKTSPTLGVILGIVVSAVFIGLVLRQLMRNARIDKAADVLYKQMGDRVAALEIGETNLRAQLQTATDRNNALFQNITNLQGRYDALENRFTSLQREYVRLQTEYSTLKGQHEEQGRQLTRIRERSEVREQEMGKLQARIQELEKK